MYHHVLIGVPVFAGDDEVMILPGPLVRPSSSSAIEKQETTILDTVANVPLGRRLPRMTIYREPNSLEELPNYATILPNALTAKPDDDPMRVLLAFQLCLKPFGPGDPRVRFNIRVSP